MASGDRSLVELEAGNGWLSSPYLERMVALYGWPGPGRAGTLLHSGWFPWVELLDG